MRQVFISYSSADAARAEEIVKSLEAAQIRCWMAPRNIRVGSNYTKDIPRAIKECPCFLLVLSPRSQESKWVNKELTRAINQEKTILPLMIEDFTVSEGFEFLLEDVQIRPYFSDPEAILREVLARIRRAAPQPESAPPAENLSPDEMWRKGKALYGEGKHAEAVAWYQKAADLGYVNAQADLGFCYHNGTGVPQSYGKAVHWFRKAADKGSKFAQNNLCVYYVNGWSVPKDQEMAVYWCRKAAEQDHVDSQAYLAYCYSQGLGVSKDEKAALSWYQRAAQNGSVVGQYNLAVFYENGTGTAKNLEEAIKWYRKAAGQGYDPAKKALERLETA